MDVENQNIQVEDFVVDIDNQIKHVEDLNKELNNQIKKDFDYLQECGIKLELKDDFDDPKNIIDDQLVFQSNSSENDITNIVPYSNHNADDIETELSTSIQLLKNLENDVKKKHICHICKKYKTQSMKHLQRHILTHGIPSDITLFKCTECPYGTPLKHNLHRHMLVHKAESEVELFKCPHCPLNTKHGRNINKHIMMCHPEHSTGEKFFCYSCKFVTNIKDNLIRHINALHVEPKIKGFQCIECPYKTKIKWYLEKHILRHKTPVEKKKFKCPHCPYESILKTTLENHVLTHKKPWEVDMFKCTSCPYATKSKKNINRHVNAWTDMKLRMKSKAAKIKLERSKTGGGQENIKELNHVEERVLAIIGHHAVEGDSNKEFGIGATNPQPVKPKRKVDNQTPSTSGVQRRLTDRTLQVENIHVEHMHRLEKISNTLSEINRKLDGISQAIQKQGEQITALNINLNNIFQ